MWNTATVLADVAKVIAGQRRVPEPINRSLTAIATWINLVNLDDQVKASKSIVDNTLTEVGTVTTNDTVNVALAKLKNSYALCPTGAVMFYPKSTPPTGWLICDGTAVSRSTYSELYAVCGVSYGAGDGVNTFNLPNLKGKVPVGTDSADADFNSIGESGGSKSAVASHTHAIDHNHAAFTSGSTGHSHQSFADDGMMYFGDVFGSGGLSGIRNWSGGTKQRTDTAYHTHDIDVPNHTGASGSQGTANGNLPPYQVFLPIIRTGKLS